MIVIVSGLPRSGTSMMMNMLEAGGMDLLVDNVRKADKDNPRGYFEYELVKKLPEGNIIWLESANSKVVKVVSYYIHHLPPRYEYKVLFMERNFDEILESQKQSVIEKEQTTSRKEDKMMTDYFKNHVKQTKEWISLQPNFSVLYLSYNEIVLNPEQYLDKINTFLELELNKEKMSKIVDKNLYRQRSK